MRPSPLAARLLGAMTIVALGGTPLSGQASRPEPGSRVRITAPAVELDRTVGTLEGFSGDTILFAPQAGLVSGRQRRIPKALVERLELQAGERGHTGSGILLGMLGGLTIVGFGVGSLVDCGDYDQNLCRTVFGVVGLGAGALIGGGIGASARSEAWIDFDLAAPLGLGVVGWPDGVGLGLRLRGSSRRSPQSANRR